MSNSEPVLRIVLVCGPTGCGKSTYVADNLLAQAYDVVDLYQFQEPSSYPERIPSGLTLFLSHAFFEWELLRSAERAYLMEAGMRDLMGGEGREPELVVAEGTFMKAARRAPILQTLKKFTSRGACTVECVCVINDRADERARGQMEIPTVEEGFDSVTLVGDFELKRPLEELSRLVEAQKARDRVAEKGYFAGCGEGERENGR